WYTTAHIERLIGAYIKHDADTGRERTVRELVAEFRGLSATAKQKRVLDATGLARAPLSALISGNGFVRPRVEDLLAAMKANSAPVKPVMLGTSGKEHFSTTPRRRRLRDRILRVSARDGDRGRHPLDHRGSIRVVPEGEAAPPDYGRQLVARHPQPVPRIRPLRHEFGHNLNPSTLRHRRPGDRGPPYRLPARRIH